MKLFERLAGLRTDFTVCVQPSSSKDGEGLRKSLQFDTKVNILRENETGKALESFTICWCDLWIHKVALLLPTPMTVSLHCAMFAEHGFKFALHCHAYIPISHHSPTFLHERLVLGTSTKTSPKVSFEAAYCT